MFIVQDVRLQHHWPTVQKNRFEWSYKSFVLFKVDKENTIDYISQLCVRCHTNLPHADKLFFDVKPFTHSTARAHGFSHNVSHVLGILASIVAKYCKHDVEPMMPSLGDDHIHTWP